MIACEVGKTPVVHAGDAASVALVGPKWRRPPMVYLSSLSAVACEVGKTSVVHVGNAAVMAFVGPKRRRPTMVYFSSLSAMATDMLGASLISAKPASYSVGRAWFHER